MTQAKVEHIYDFHGQNIGSTRHIMSQQVLPHLKRCTDIDLP